MTIQISAYPSQKYVGLTAFAPEETLRFIAVVNDIFIVLFQPSEYKENFLLRFLEYP
ncbi:hypothetical protein [Spirulina sp. 06S082]|uniref:hypothetical protein n=1 Tax=Spirulina sp. 06S082 TaxID=3110248 RepID=UPI002B21B40C|nr:hypothetical protein [Spirulina sp. 06S082]MEA5469379.1 hypothetical protein [Spirulina sp. 06S082]